mgnify:CR=1 FL=1
MLIQIGSKHNLDSTKNEVNKIKNSFSDYVTLFTCERTEIYTTEKIKTSLPKKEGIEALRHLLRVCCGIDSLVIGEIEILEQVNRALKRAIREDHCSKILKEYFMFSIKSSKEVRESTNISQSFSLEFINKVIKKHPSQPPIVVVGEGALASKLIYHLKKMDYPNFSNFSEVYHSKDKIEEESIILVANKKFKNQKMFRHNRSHYVYDLRHPYYQSLVKDLELNKNIQTNKAEELIELKLENLDEIKQPITLQFRKR